MALTDSTETAQPEEVEITDPNELAEAETLFGATAAEEEIEITDPKELAEVETLFSTTAPAPRKRSFGTPLADTLKQTGLFGSAMSAIGTGDFTDIKRKPSGDWEIPFMAKNTGKTGLGGLGESLAGMGAALDQRFGGEMRDTLLTDSAPVQKVFHDFQQANNLSDEEMNEAWNDLWKSQKPWTEDEKARVFSNGTVRLNPLSKDYFDDAKVEATLTEAGASPEARAEFMSQLPQARADVAGDKLLAYESAAQVANSPLTAGVSAAVNPLAVPALMAAGSVLGPSQYAAKQGYTADKVASPEFIREYETEVLDKQGAVGSKIRGLATDTMLGFNKTATMGLGLAGYMGNDAAATAAAESSEAGGVVQQGKTDTGMVGAIVQEAPSVALQIVASQLTGGLSLAATGGRAAGAIGFTSAVANAGAQSLGLTYAQERADGKTHEEAQKKAQVSALNTAVVTGIFQGLGAGGVEKVAAGKPVAAITLRDVMKAGTRQEVWQNTRAFVGGILKDAAGEASEEAIDQFTSTFLNADPDSNLASVWNDTWEAFKVGGALGGATVAAMGVGESFGAAPEIPADAVDPTTDPRYVPPTQAIKVPLAPTPGQRAVTELVTPEVQAAAPLAAEAALNTPPAEFATAEDRADFEASQVPAEPTTPNGQSAPQVAETPTATKEISASEKDKTSDTPALNKSDLKAVLKDDEQADASVELSRALSLSPDRVSVEREFAEVVEGVTPKAKISPEAKSLAKGRNAPKTLERPTPMGEAPTTIVTAQQEFLKSKGISNESTVSPSQQKKLEKEYENWVAEKGGAFRITLPIQRGGRNLEVTDWQQAYPLLPDDLKIDMLRAVVGNRGRTSTEQDVSEAMKRAEELVSQRDPEERLPDESNLFYDISVSKKATPEMRERAKQMYEAAMKFPAPTPTAATQPDLLTIPRKRSLSSMRAEVLRKLSDEEVTPEMEARLTGLLGRIEGAMMGERKTEITKEASHSMDKAREAVKAKAAEPAPTVEEAPKSAATETPTAAPKPLPKTFPKSLDKLATAPTREGIEKQIAKFYGGESKTLVPIEGRAGYYAVGDTGMVVVEAARGFAFGVEKTPAVVSQPNEPVPPPFSEDGITIADQPDGSFLIEGRLGKQVGDRWVVQTEENRQKADRGERQIGGDAIFKTRDEAISETRREILRERANEESRKAAKEREAAQQRAQQEKDAPLDAYLDSRKLTAMQRGKLKATLSEYGGKRDSNSGKTYDGNRFTVINTMVADGFAPTTEEVPRIQELSRGRINRMDNAEQRAFERRKEAAGMKTEYRISKEGGGYFVVTKAEYDLAQWAMENTPAVQSAPSKVLLSERAIRTRMEDKDPLPTDAVDTYGITLPKGYVRQGDLYVFQAPESTARSPIQRSIDEVLSTGKEVNISLDRELTESEMKRAESMAAEAGVGIFFSRNNILIRPTTETPPTRDRNKFPGKDYAVQPNVVYVQPRGLDTNPMSDQVFTYPYDGTAENAAKVGAKAFMDLQEQFPEMSQRESIFGASDDTGMREYRLEMNQFADEVAVYSKKGERVGVTPAIETAPPKVGNTGAIPTDEEAARWDAAEAYIRPKIAAMEGDALDAFGKSVGVKRQGVSDEAYRERILGNTHPDDLLDALAGDSERFQTSPELDNLLPYENTNIERRDVATAVARLASRIEADRTREDGGDVSQRSEADAQSLLSWAESEGRIIREDDFRKLIDTLPDRAGEAEHDVFTLRDANRVVKLTRPPTFGSQGDLLTYIENIERSNELFSDDVTLHGVVQTANGPALVTSQLYIAGSRPTQVEIDNWFRSQGYESTGFNRWKNPSTGAEVADTHEGNLIKLPNGGMVPIDVQVLSAGESDIRFQATPENIQFLQSLTNTPATYEYTPYDENRERIRQYAEAQGITLVRTDSPFLGATARRIYETYGVETIFYTGGDILSQGFSPESNPDFIFIRADEPKISLGWTITHELTHAAGKDPTAGRDQLIPELSALLTEKELLTIAEEFAKRKYKTKAFDSELVAYLTADAVMGTNHFNIDNLVRSGRVKALLNDWMRGLSYLKPTGLKDVSDAELLGDPNTRLQGRPQGAKGSAQLTAEGKVLIKLFDKGDFTTITHEMAHAFEMTGYGDLTDGEVATLKAWAGSSSEGRKAMERKPSEKFARGWERYIAEGRAPLAHLQAIFDKMAKWMLDVYGQIKGSEIDIDISPEVRAIFDKLASRMEAPSAIVTPSGVEMHTDDGSPVPPAIAPNEEAPAGMSPEDEATGRIRHFTTPVPRVIESKNDWNPDDLYSLQERRALEEADQYDFNTDAWKQAARTFGDLWDFVTNQPRGSGETMLDRLVSAGDFDRVLTDLEVATLTHEGLRRKVAVDKAQKELSTAIGQGGSKELIAQKDAALQDALSRYQTLQNIAAKARTASGRALNAWKYALRNDFSYATLYSSTLDAFNVARKADGKPEPLGALPESEQREIRKYAEQQQALQQEIERLRAANEAGNSEEYQKRIAEQDAIIAAMIEERKNAGKKTAVADLTKRLLVDRVKQAAREARARLGVASEPEDDVRYQSAPNAANDPRWYDRVLVMAEPLINNPAMSAAQFADLVRKWFGAAYEGAAQGLRKDAEKYLRSTRADISGVNVPTPEDVAKRLTSEEELTRQDVYDLARAHVYEGARNFEVMNRVFADLAEIYPDLTRDEVSQLFTNYGKQQKLSPVEEAKALRAARALELVQKQIDDLETRGQMKRTGLGKDEPSAELRALRKRRDDLAKEMGYTPTDPATGLSSAQGAAKKRMANEIEELQNAIDSGSRRVRVRRGVEYTAEMQELRDKLLAKRDEYDNIFGQERTPEERMRLLMAGLDRQIAKERDLINKGILKEEKKGLPPLDSPELTARREALKQLREEKFAAYDLLHPGERSLNQAMKEAHAALERRQAIVAEGLRETPQKRQRGEGVDATEALQALWEAADALDVQIREMRRNRPLTPAQQQAQLDRAYAQAVEAREVLRKRIENGDILSAPKTPKAVEERTRAMREENAALRKQITQMQRDAGVGVFSQEAREAKRIASLEARIEELRRRRAEQDFAKKVVAKPVTSQRIAELELTMEYERRMFDEARARFAFKSLGLPQRAVEVAIAAWHARQMFNLSGDFGIFGRQLGKTRTFAIWEDVKSVYRRARAGEPLNLRDGTILGKTLGAGLKAFTSVDEQNRIYAEMATHPRYAFHKANGFDLTNPHDTSYEMNSDGRIRVNPMMLFNNRVIAAILLARGAVKTAAAVSVALFTKAPVWNAVVKGIGETLFSAGLAVGGAAFARRVEAAQQTMLNVARWNILEAALQISGNVDPSEAPEYNREITEAVMTLTGKIAGKSGVSKWVKDNSYMIGLFWQFPQYKITNFQSVVGTPIFRALFGSVKDGKLRKESLQAMSVLFGHMYVGYAARMAVWAAILGVWDEEDEESTYGVVMNPDNPNFGKLKMGKTYIDFAPGWSTWMVDFNRFLSDTKLDSKALREGLEREKVKTAQDRGQVLESFLTKQIQANWRTGYEFLSKREFRQGGELDRMDALNQADLLLGEIVMNLTARDIAKIYEEHDPATASILTSLLMTGQNITIRETNAEKAAREAEEAKRFIK